MIHDGRRAMSAETGRLADRLAHAYDMPPADVRSALAALQPVEAEIDAISFERDGDQVLLVQGGEVVASLPLGSMLPPIASSCDTLDPYGDRDDMLATALVHDPHSPRLATTSGA